MTRYNTIITLPKFGKVFLFSEDNKLVVCALEGQKNFPTNLVNNSIKDNDLSLFQDIKDKLLAYENRLCTDIHIPYKLNGTDFQISVWNELAKIPYGKTRSYLDIAKAINKPSAVRSVANAIGKNPLLFIIPCHRVIGSNGKLTGFAAGLSLKKNLLKLEST